MVTLDYCKYSYDCSKFLLFFGNTIVRPMFKNIGMSTKKEKHLPHQNNNHFTFTGVDRTSRRHNSQKDLTYLESLKHLKLLIIYKSIVNFYKVKCLSVQLKK